MTIILNVGLKKHVGQIGINEQSHGKYDRHECKAICRADGECRGFSFNNLSKECFTHTQIDHSISMFDFYELPSECLV